MPRELAENLKQTLSLDDKILRIGLTPGPRKLLDVMKALI